MAEGDSLEVLRFQLHVLTFIVDPASQLREHDLILPFKDFFTRIGINDEELFRFLDDQGVGSLAEVAFVESSDIPSSLQRYLSTLISLIGTVAPQRVLFDGKNAAVLDYAKLKQWKGVVTSSDSAIIFSGNASRNWPGFVIPATGGKWDLSSNAYVTVSAKNSGAHTIKLHVRLENHGGDHKQRSVQRIMLLASGASGELKIELRRASPLAMSFPAKCTGPPWPPFGPTYGSPNVIDPAQLCQIAFLIGQPAHKFRVEIFSVRACGTYVPPTPTYEVTGNFLPFIDTFGQYIHRDWEGKTKSQDDLLALKESEARNLKKSPTPAEWNKYGGWAAGPTLTSSGFFHTEKHGGKWWFVDPEGKLFWSMGLNCVKFGESTPVDGREKWFLSDSRDKIFMSFWKHTRCFDFGRSNLRRKYGEDWAAQFASITHQRLRSWGVNTIGNWSDVDIYRQRKTPYTVGIHIRGTTLAGSLESGNMPFRDIFDPLFDAELSAHFQKEIGSSANDPWCVGYFVDNEIAWGNEVSIALMTLQCPATQLAKRIFVDDLKKKYKIIGALNAAWGTQLSSWEGFIQQVVEPDRIMAAVDLVAFNVKTVETYFQKCRDALKAVSPNQLYLGCRFVDPTNLQVESISSKFCDVLSYNIYQRSPVASRVFPKDVPVMITEYHFGALDRGVFGAGLVEVKDQSDRAEAFKRFVRDALVHPQVVGCHWFQYRDQSTTGRALDGENYQIGFIDIADTTYPEMTAASRELGANLYSFRIQAERDTNCTA